ncbi:hydroxymethylpyrimidine/phosphomethylpyrimidine kinase [Methylovulum psychrotolerans]|uniref:bifunctional hydroxymethylpyrimidine kinase/phosphomethylpyrimidine kinase n=1 Tax=Methylovulum psychrotolerans TaxID=1704499 RepID=UPI001BFEFA8A|nr:hydroxymethylpyrimidine/phosphomethylpyrimidine kinase [Methylovulum psychrotolerans]MBT9096916.1 hydroxymethylpyrimidine/phosphomethylpyrimidine kinase [Methylovulum psychrotolerans]
MNPSRPIVLSFSGHDPSGGAGIQADIETLVSHQCHAVSVITALTEQDTRNVKRLIPQSSENIISQAKTLLNDMAVNAFKIGLIGHHETALAIYAILKQYPDIPVILDPVLAAGGGADLSNDRLIATVVDLLLPCTTVLTPNSEEARKLANLEDLSECGLSLLEAGSEYVLITGTHESTPSVQNQLFHDERCWETYTWERLPASYHGSGCTLATSIAALMAHGLSPIQAVLEAQEYTWNSLNTAYQTGKGQYNPNRFFWMEDDV